MWIGIKITSIFYIHEAEREKKEVRSLVLWIPLTM